MWSWPRNISTAMMRAWENRPDTAVVDEPFYACFLKNSPVRHPMHEAVLASQDSTWKGVTQGVLAADLSPYQHIQYQKQMTHHMIADIDISWFQGVTHAFLIRHPGDVLHSYIEKRENPTASDIGFARQRKLYELACQYSNKAVPIVDSKDVLLDPKGILQQLCHSLGVSFKKDMLRWPAGPRQSDGVWASHWYNKVHESTGFSPYREKHYSLTAAQQSVVDESLPHYEYLYERRLKLG